MATITLHDSSTGDKQGWYSSTSTSGSGATLTMSFNTSEMSNFASLADNITISKAILHVNCAKSGADRKKIFRLRLYAGSTLCYDHGTELYSNEYAYNDSDVPITLNASGVKKWLSTSGTKKITSVDPQTGKYFSLSSGYCSYNYVRVTDSWLVITYTYNQSSATLGSTIMDIGDSYGININAGSDSYTHDVILTIGSNSYTLLEKVSGGAQTFTIPISIGTNNLSSSTSVSGTITINTYDSSGSLLAGTPYSYSVTITADSGHGPNAPTSVTITTNKSCNSVYYALSNISTVTIQPSGATGKDGASIKSYQVTFNGSTKTCDSGKATSFTSPIVTGSSTVKYSATIKAIDSRGYSSSAYTKDIYVSPYIYPSAQITTLCRWNVTTGIQDDVDGTAVKIVYNSFYTPKLYSISGAELMNSFSLSYYIAEEFQDTIESGAIISSQVFDTEQNYKFKFLASDLFSSEDLKDVSEYSLGSAMYLLHFRNGENSVGIGCAGEKIEDGERGKITLGWPVYFRDSVTLNDALPIKQGGTGVSSEDGLRKKIGNLMYPVGSIYMSVSNTHPSELFGGTWVTWGAGRVPISAGIGTDINSLEKQFSGPSSLTEDITGGEYTHTLTIAESPSHYHVPGREASSSNGSNTHFSTNVTLGSDEVLRATVASGTEGGTVIKSTAGTGWLYDTRTTSTVGGDQSHNIIQPYITCYMWKRTG